METLEEIRAEAARIYRDHLPDRLDGMSPTEQAAATARGMGTPARSSAPSARQTRCSTGSPRRCWKKPTNEPRRAGRRRSPKRPPGQGGRRLPGDSGDRPDRPGTGDPAGDGEQVYRLVTWRTHQAFSHRCWTTCPNRPGLRLRRRDLAGRGDAAPAVRPRPRATSNSLSFESTTRHRWRWSTPAGTVACTTQPAQTRSQRRPPVPSSKCWRAGCRGEHCRWSSTNRCRDRFVKFSAIAAIAPPGRTHSCALLTGAPEGADVVSAAQKA